MGTTARGLRYPEATVLANTLHTQIKNLADDVEAISSKSGWLAFPLANGWVNYGGNWETAAYMRLAGVVYLRGLITAPGAYNSVIGYLPAGFRPNSDTHIPAMGHGSAFAAWNIMANGEVKVNTPLSAGQYISLRTIPFPADQ